MSDGRPPRRPRHSARGRSPFGEGGGPERAPRPPRGDDRGPRRPSRRDDQRPSRQPRSSDAPVPSSPRRGDASAPRPPRPPRPQRQPRSPDAPPAPPPRPPRPPREPRSPRRDEVPSQRPARRPTSRELPERTPRERVQPPNRTREQPFTRRTPPPREDLVYGRNPVVEAARAGRVKRVLMAEGLEADERLAELMQRTSVELVPPERLERLVPGAVHQGVVAEVRPRHFATLREVVGSRPTLLVALDSILDPQNLGAILRSAEASGADAVILPERNTAPITAVAAKASAGASEHLNLARVAGLAGAISDIKRAGIWTVALDPRGELLPWEFDFTQPVCVVVGGEGAGVHRLIRERADVRVRLPMAGQVASLNASAAAAQLLYEVQRQRAGTSAG